MQDLVQSGGFLTHSTLYGENEGCEAAMLNFTDSFHICSVLLSYTSITAVVKGEVTKALGKKSRKKPFAYPQKPIATVVLETQCVSKSTLMKGESLMFDGQGTKPG